MRNTFFILVCLGLFQNSLFPQPPQAWGAFSQRIDAQPYQGKAFRLQAAVKVKLIDSNAEGEIWVRVDKLDKKMGFFYNMMDKPIRLNEWKMYNITGKIDKSAAWFVFGGLYHHKGLFYFDDFRLSVETEKNKWEEISVAESGFEGDTTSIKKSWGFLQKRAGIEVHATQDEAYSGKQSFLADASNFKPPRTFGDNDTAGAYADVNGIRMYYEIYGQGQPLVLLHGNSESIGSFNKQIPELSKHFKVIAIDSRGQGRSTEDGKKFTYELFAADTKALLDHLHLDSVCMLGWSDGGNIGLIMAMQYPAKVKRLAVMGANLYNNSSSVKPWVNKTLRKEYNEIKDDTTYGSLFRKRMIDLLLYEPNLDEKELQKISCPVLVMAGSDDVIKESHTKLIASGIKQSQLVIFPKGNHYEPSERPERFNKTVLDFLMHD
jgi:pimeloyl-ACP methyl ester carboxylesterase